MPGKKSTKSSDIYGIRHHLRTERMREAVRSVLGQIRKRSSRDFDRCRDLVRDIRPHSAVEFQQEGVVGKWEPYQEDEDDPQTWVSMSGEQRGVLWLFEGQTDCSPLATVAHELGHACTRYRDLQRRRGGPGCYLTDEWASELAADWYAYKWGFGRLIAKARKERDWMHHGVGPGQTYSEVIDGKEYHYRITRNFVARRVNPLPSSKRNKRPL